MRPVHHQPEPRSERGGILFIVREFISGGAAFLVLRHLQRLPASLRIDLLVTGPHSAALLARLPAGVGVELIDDRIARVDQDLLQMRLALSALELSSLSHDYDTVLGGSLFPDLAACAAFSLSRAGRKLILLLDEGLLATGRSGQAAAAMRGALLAADHLVPVSQALLNRLGQHDPLLLEIPATVLHPPIEAPSPDNSTSPFADRSDSQRLRVLTVARLSAEKQLGTCLMIHRRLRRAGLDFDWHILGDGQQRRRLRWMATLLGMADRFHLEGFQDDPRIWMRHADLFVLCSRSEGCPTVIREALAEGTPVLSTDVNGVRELVEEGVSGMVVDNHPARIEAALARLVSDRALRQSLRRGIARRHSIVSTTSETQQLLAIAARQQRRDHRRARVSILIPTYNQQACIGTAIHSALMQDYPDLEVIVCDDASSDATMAIAAGLRHDRRLRLHSNPTNLGRVANYRRSLLHEASGDWVLMLDGDDHLCDPGFISRAMLALARQGADQPVFLQAGHRVTWRAGSGRTPRRPDSVAILPAIAGSSKRISGADYLRFVFETGFFSHLGSLYQRQAAIRSQFYCNDISSADMDSLLRLALTGDVLLLRTIAGCWVQHGRNASAHLPLQRIEENVRIFRGIVQAAAAAGCLKPDAIEASLTRYEAHLMANLFPATIGHSAHRIRDALRMLAISRSVNPRSIRQPLLLIAWSRCLLRLSLRSLWRRLAEDLPGRRKRVAMRR